MSDIVSDPRVTLLAHSVLTSEALDVMDRDTWSTSDSDHLAEIAGRECYQSWGRPNPATASNADYLASVIAKRHTSVLAHASFTFRLTGVSRTLTHELIRHRFLAVTEVSQRYVDMRDSYTVIPPDFRGDTDDDFEARDIITRQGGESDAAYDALVAIATRKLAREGITGTAARKRARQAARYVLPGGTDTKMIVSGNVRAWRDFVNLRNTPDADEEIHEIAGAVLAVLRVHAPHSVSDLVGTDVQ